MDTQLFDPFPLTDSQIYQLKLVRAKAYELLALMNDGAKASREKSLAITKLEESMMWYSKAIARSEISS